MKIINKFLALGLMVLTVSCAVSVEIPKDVTYDYNVNVDLKNLKTYDLRPIPTTVGIEPLMLERIKTAIDTELMFKKLEKTSDNPDFLVIMYGVRSRLFTTAWRGPDANLIVDKGKLILKFIDPKTNQIIWWAEAKTILDHDMIPENKTDMVNEVVRRILQKFPPASSS
ncbi:MAG: DUF4136 domain-containing protein [Desulfobacterales bacterium]|jgi:hypothetical protein|nr:DUF4136 domain-containing protein [Desulfobacterales bacterium]